MGRIAHLQMQCPHCTKTTSVYVEECDSERVDVKCEHCRKVFEFGPGALYSPVAYVAAMPAWAVIDKAGPGRPGDDLQAMLERTNRTALTCPNCHDVFTFEQGAALAMDSGIRAKVVMCPYCAYIYAADVTPQDVTLGSVDLNETYATAYAAGCETIRHEANVNPYAVLFGWIGRRIRGWRNRGA